MKVMFMRHGETELNKARRAQGWTDSYLTKNGERQIKEAAERVKNIKFDAIIASPLGRTMTTARAIKEYHEVSFSSSKMLMEYSMGVYENQDLEAPEWKITRENFYLEDFEFPGGESYVIVKNRIDDFLIDLLTNARTKDYKNVLLVTHGGVIHTLLTSVLTSKEDRKIIIDTPINNTGTIQVEVSIQDGELKKTFFDYEKMPKKS